MLPKNQRMTSRQNPALVDAHNTIAQRIGMLTRDQAWDQCICARCRGNVDPKTSFRDELSKREYRLSALCQDCQDAFEAAFGED